VPLLQYERRLSESPLLQVDAQYGNTILEVRHDIKEVKRLRGTFLEMAEFAAADLEKKVVLILPEPLVSDERIREEWTAFTGVVRTELLPRLIITIRRGSEYIGIPEAPAAHLHPVIDEVIQHIAAKVSRTPRGSETYYDILRILIHQWMRQAGPMTAKWIGDTAGCSYPTVAAALDRLEKYLTRQADRRVELRSFPRDEWSRFVANADHIRGTRRYADRSGQPRSIDSLLTRVQRAKPKGVAIGGVPGAKRFFAALDLVGTPRLDLTIQSRRREPDLGFLRQLDPALYPAEKDEPARLVVHLLHQPVVFFETDAAGALWADPVECLLDLHELRLEAQATDFLAHVSPK
jgi:hypothetical protein